GVRRRIAVAAAAALPGNRAAAHHLAVAMTWYPAPGKLNLFLHVLGLRADGYHELQTVFRLIDLCDRVGIAPRSDGAVRLHEPVVTARFPEIAAQLAWLKSRCPQARMTGSGACVFAEFETRVLADVVQSQLPGGMSGFVAQGLERHPLHDRAD